MAGEVSHVLRIPRSDEEGSFILARVSPSGAASRPLNAKLVATEGVAPYVLTLRHDRIDKLRGKNAPCSPDEWERILAFLLRGQGFVENVDATATVVEESSLTIAIRKRVQNITQRLGSLSLEYDGDEGIELFDWCGEAVESRTRIEKDLAKATAQESELKTAVDELKAQLDEFLKTKDADETAMLESFCKLLNEKKVKIRIQQRLLAKARAADEDEAARDAAIAEVKADVDAENEDEGEAAAPARGQRAARGRLGKVGSGQANRGAKRRAAAPLEEEESDSEEDGFEKATTSTSRKPNLAEAAEAEAAESDTHSEEDDRTTEHDDESTESEPEAMEEVKNEEASQPKKARSGRTAAKKAAGKQAASTGQPSKQPESVPEEAPPPRRNLAFGKARGAAAASGSARGAAAASGSASAARKEAAPPSAATRSKDHDMDDSETESDDEL